MNHMIYAGLHVFHRKQFVKNKKNPPIDMTSVADVIKYTVCNHMDEDVKDVESPSRKRELVVTRQICMFFLLKETNLSLKKIGKMFGNRDHSTVIYANQTVNDLIDTDRKFKKQIEELEKVLDSEIKGFKGD